MRKVKEIQLYRFKGFDWESFNSQYLEEISEHDETVIDNVDVFTGECESHVVHHKAKRGTVSLKKIADKCMYLQDACIRESRANEDQSFKLNSSVLKAVLGNEYKVILDILRKQGYIVRSGNYVSGKTSFTYKLLKDTELTEPCINTTIQGYKEKTFDELRKLVTESVNEVADLNFMEWYEKSLKYIQIEDIDGMRTAVGSLLKENPKAALYYDTVFERFESKVRYIDKVDPCHRFYHVLTNLKRELKQYLTIDFSLDCRNSHPILFNHYIYKEHNISDKQAYNISVYLNTLYNSSNSFNQSEYSGNSLHYLGENLRNTLISSNIEINSVAKFSDDELEYIYRTSRGEFWDDFLVKHPEMDKKELKESLFRSVFYKRGKGAGSKLAKEFEEKYPTVFKLLSEWKGEGISIKRMKKMNDQGLLDQGGASLSYAMMDFESDIFIDILKRLYAKRWHAVHIHDCIVIPKDGNKNHPTRDQVQQIMLEEYAKRGLCPSFD